MPVVAASPSASGEPLGELLHGGAGDGGSLDIDASALDRVLDGTLEGVFDPQRPIEIPAAVVAADPAMP